MRRVRLGLVFGFALALAAQEPAPPAKPAEPKERRQGGYGYDVNGRPVLPNPGAREERRGAVVERQEQLRDSSGRPVTVRSTEDRTVSEQGGNSIRERIIQRYDPTGKPTSKQVVRLETRKLGDGTTLTTETLYDQDLSGRMQFTERRTTTEKQTASGGSGTVVVERPAAGSSVQVVERIDRTDTKRGDSVESVSSRQLLNANGRLEEREREQSVADKSGDVTKKESKRWEVGTTGKLDLVERSVSNARQKADGSLVEDLEVYTTRIAGTTPDLNAPGVPTLEQQVHREKKVQADGKIVEKTSAKLRKVAEPTRLTGLMVTEQVTTPTADGQTIETKVSERDTNGRIVPVQTVVEEQKK